METQIKATIVAGVDKKSFNDGVNYATDTGKKIDSALVVNYKLNIAELQFNLEKARRLLREAKADGDKNAIIKAQLDVNTLSGQVTEAKRILKNYTTQGDENVSRLQAKFNGLGTSIKDSLSSFIGAAAIVTGISAITKAVIKLGANLEQTKIAFTTMLGSAEAADKLLRDLSTFAKNTPFDLVGIRETSKQLLAMGVDSGNLIGTLKILGDVSAGLSVPLERLALAYGQVLAKGRLQGGELKQFTEAGVPLIAELAKNLGVAESAISDLVTAGKVSALDVTKAFQTMTSEGGKFANLMQQQSKSFNGIVSNIGDSITQIGEKIGGKLIPQLSQVATGIAQTVSDYGDSLGTILADSVSTIGNVITTAAQGFVEIFNVLALNTNKAKQDQLDFVQVVVGAFQIIVNGVKAITLAIQGAGALIGTFLGVAINNVSKYFNDAGNIAINTINAISSGINKITGSKIGKIDLFTTLPKLNYFNELKGTLKEVSDSFLNTDFSVGIRKATKEAEKLNTSLDFSKITDTGKTDSQGGGLSKAEKELKDAGYASEFMKNEIEGTNKAMKELADERAKDLKDKGVEAFVAFDDAIKESSKSIDELKGKLDDVNKELDSVTNDIGKRVIEIENELKGIDTKIGSDTADQADFDKRVALEQELALAKANINAETLQKVRDEEAKSETQKLLDRQTALLLRQQELQADIDFETKLNEDLKLKKEEFLRQVTETYGIEIQKQTDILATEAAKQISLYRSIEAAARAAARAGGVGSGDGTIPGRAVGGPVSAGSPYIVGERGPELMVPNQNGTIVPNNVLNNNINIDATISNEIELEYVATKLAEKILLSRKGIF